MRSLTLAIPAVLVVALSACAPTAGSSHHDDELSQLAAECEARNGVLVATGRQTGRARLDNSCRITGTSRLPGN